MEPKHDLWIVAKHILIYVYGTIYHCLRYTDNEIQLVGYIDSCWCGNETNKISMIGECFNLGSSMVSWMRKKQHIVALNSVEGEYIVASKVYQEAIWLWKLLTNLFEGPLSPTWIHCDN